MQIVVHHNTVVDYCEHGYVCMGTTVVCPEKGLTFQDCEIVTVDSVPVDIATRKYDYENGLFIPSEKGVPFGVATLNETGKVPSEQLPEVSFVTTIMTASGWSGKTYSFETEYPKATYDVSIEVAPTATAEQFEAFGGAMICGSADSNIATALGDVPTVDIPIIIKAVRK